MHLIECFDDKMTCLRVRGKKKKSMTLEENFPDFQATFQNLQITELAARQTPHSSDKQRKSTSRAV